MSLSERRVRLMLPLAGVLAGVLAAALAGCSATSAEPPVSGLVQVDDGVVLEYRDYGGEGEAIVLMTGLGNSAAVYDDLAPRLTEGHRVIALSRRGFGLSSAPADGYDVATRVDDDLAALDALGIDRALLVGHSIAGDELTGIAQQRPGLATGLVYLDAAIDRTHPAMASIADCSPAVAPSPTQVADLESGGLIVVDGEEQIATFEAAEAIQAAALGGALPRAEALRQVARTSQGYYELVDRQRVIQAIAEGSAQTGPDYRGITVPITVLAADQADPAAAYPTAALADAEVRAALEPCARRIAEAMSEAGFGQVRAAVPEARIEVIPGAPHYVFLKEPALVAERILQAAATGAGSGS